MPKNVIITPASGLIDFRDVSNVSEATLQLDDIGNLNITNSGGVLSIGNTAANLYIGDGTTSVDIIFEQNGAVRALAGKTLTLGNGSSSVAIAGTITSPLTISTGVAAPLIVSSTTAVTNLNADLLDGQHGTYYQTALGFTPVQQGGGTGQGTNKTYIGWATDASGLLAQVDSTNFGNTWPINISKNAATVTNGVYTNIGQRISVSGIKQFDNSNVPIASSSGGLAAVEAYGTGGAAFMSFHRPGIYAGYFGIDTDNVWKVGGWSMGAVAYAILHSNNYNTYAPTLTGTGASGSWGISVTGNSTNVTGTVAIANGGTGATTASGAITALGAYASTNPSGYTSNAGTVTSVGGTGSVSGLTLSGTVTTTGSLTLGGTLAVLPSNFASQTANTVLAAPTGAAGTPTFRLLVSADVPTLNQSTTGSAATLTTGRTVALTGDVLYTSDSFNGSANVTGTATLASIGTAGTYTKVTTDAKGRVTSGASLAASDIPVLDAGKITTGVFDAARLPSYVDDVLEYANLASFPATGETGKIYVAIDTNKTYRWSGSVYVFITSGAVDSVAGKTGVVTLVKADVGLGSVDNTADSTKTVSSAATLTTGRTVALTGDVAYTSGSFTGAANVTGTATLASVGTAGTYTKVTTDVKGRVTSGTTLTAADIPELTLENLPTSAFKRSVRAATTANITLSGTQTIDGIAVIASDRVLVKNQTTASQNGIYIVAAGAWTRAADADSTGDIASALVNIDSGTANGSEIWTNTFRGTDTLGTTDMKWYEVLYNTGTWGISITGNAATVTNGVYTTGTQSIGGIKTFTSNIRCLSNTVAASNIDCSLGNYFSKIITANTTFTVSNVPINGIATAILLDLINGGAFTVTWWANLKWAAGTAPSLTASGRDTLGFFTYDNGTTWTGLVLGKDIK